MGLFGLALDGNQGRSHKLYVADMNGRILRLGLGAHPAAPEVFSQVPASTGLAGDWMLSMWNDLVFDKTGNLYVPDDKPRIWRVSSGRHGHDLGHRPAAHRLLRVRRRPARWPDRPDRHLAVRLDHRLGRVPARVAPSIGSGSSTIRPLRTSSSSTGSRSIRAPAPPQATGLAFAKSGNLYVSLIGPNQIAVLDPAGDEIDRISTRGSTRRGGSPSSASRFW